MSRARRTLLLAPLVAAAAACGSVLNDDFRLETVTAGHPTDPALPIAVAERWIVYMADEAAEAGGTDLNGDGDAVDSVAFAIDMVKRREFALGVAAREAAVVGNQVFLVVDEAAELPDGTALAPGDPTLSLANWDRDLDAPVHIDDVADLPGPLLRAVGDRVYYPSAATPATPSDSTLRFVERQDPMVPVPVRSGDGLGRLAGTPIRAFDGLLVVRLRESTPAFPTGDWPDEDLNGDGDLDDEVLGLLDATDPGAPLLSTGLAYGDALDARLVAGLDWLVGFLVDEEGEGVDLDDPALFDPAWVPEGCPGLAANGVQAGHAVLHHVRFRDLEAGGAPVNTGLLGDGRVAVTSEVVATLSAEGDVGCDLNGDGDSVDTVARWVEAVPAGDPVLPPGALVELHAVDTGAGPSRGLATLAERLVIVVDEAADGRDFDGDPADRSLVASRDPLEPLESDFVFEHRSGVAAFDEDLDAFVTTQPYVGASWMSDRAQLGRVAIACEEEVAGVTLNRNDFCDDVQKDADLADVVAVWPRVRSASERANLEPDFPLTFPGLGYALDAANPGLVLAGGYALARVSEQADRRDHNGDGDRSDVVLFANPLGGCAVSFLGDSTNAVEPVAFSDGQLGGAFRSDETLAGVDLDGDGDADDVVVQYFRF